MLRINLLPSYVSQRRLTKRLIVPFILLFALCVAAPLSAYFVVHGQLTKLTQDAADAVAGKAKTDGYKADAVTTLAQVQPINAKLQFVDAIYDYDRVWIEKYNTLAETSPKSSFIYTGAAITGPTMAIKAYSPSVEEVGRYLQVMYHEPDFSTVAVDKIPAYPDNIRHLYFLDGVLVFADGASSSGATSQNSSSPGGYPGSQNGGNSSAQGGQASAGAPSNFTPEALGPNGPSNVPPGVGPPPPQLLGEYGSAGAGGRAGSQGGGQSGAGGYSPRFLAVAGRNISPFASQAVRDQILAKALRRIVVKTVPKGFDINVTATLKEPFTAPGLPGSAPAAGIGGGRPGGFGGPGGSGGPPSSLGRPA